MPYDVNNDPYLDTETGILRNLLGLQTSKDLKDAEAKLTTLEITALTSQDVPYFEDFNFEMLKAIHKQLFKEIYDWAGELRTVEMHKGKTSFARVEHLETSLQELFAQLKRDGYLMTIKFDEFVAGLTHYYADLIVIHPFREGNGRAIRTFLAMLAESSGHMRLFEFNISPDNSFKDEIID